MRSTAFTLMLGTTMILTAACASTETNGPPMTGSPVRDATQSRSLSTDRSAQDSTTTIAEPRPQAKPGAPLPAASIEGKGPHKSLSSSAESPGRDAVDSSVQLEAGITPLDQSEAPNDLETTRRIRQAVVQDDSLSFRAKNVMIVTKGGRVVLTGPVNTRAEADRIKGIAQSITPYRIEDRLEVRR